jgi:hypothetical protein
MTSRATTDRPGLIERISEVRRALQTFYREVDEEIAQAGPLCRLSGCCCRFEEYGHTLFVSAPEALLLLADAPEPARAIDEGATCPWQAADGRCTARAARPLGCRLFFCDPSFEARMPALAESSIGRLKRLAEERNWPWEYAPLHHHLRRAANASQLEPIRQPPEPDPNCKIDGAPLTRTTGIDGSQTGKRRPI